MKQTWRAQSLQAASYTGSAWELELEGAMQNDLVVTPPDQPAITVDNLEVAQFIYLLLNNEKIRKVIDTITSKVVLILGRFMPERKAVLDALRTELRQRGYLPIPLKYDSIDGFIRVLDEAIINPGLELHNDIQAEKAADMTQGTFKITYEA